MNEKTILALASILLIFGVGGYIMHQANNAQPEDGTAVELPQEEMPNPPSRPEDQLKDVDDELGLMNIIREFSMGVKKIVEDEGTGINVLDLVTETEGLLNETITGVELTDEQSLMVENFTDNLDFVKDMAESGASPAEIADALRPKKSS